MSFAVQKSLQKANPIYQDHSLSSNPFKSLGMNGDPALAKWYEDAYNFYESVKQGLTPQPDAAAWAEFENQMKWAYDQLFGGADAGQGWDPMNPGGQGMEEDPFGGTTGPLGSIVHSETDVRLGFIADGKVHDVFAYNFTLDVASPAATVTVELTTDTRTQPPEENLAKVVVKDPTTGGETVYLVHNISDLENFQINTPKGKKVTDLTGGLVQIGEFVEGAAGNGGGIPEGADIEGKHASFDGMGNQTYSFQPPFGGMEEITCNANADITVMNSDQVLVERHSDGSYRLTIERQDGTKVVFNIPEAYAVNLNANAHNVTFKNGGGGGGDIDGLQVAGGQPRRVSPETGGENGVPSWCLNFSLNGETAPAEPEGGVDTSEWPSELIDLLEEMGFEPEDYGSLNITDGLIEEINAGLTPPSPEFIDALLRTDNTLKSAWERVEADPEDDHAWKELRDRLVTLLSTVFPGVSETGEFPEGIEVDALLESKSIFFGDDAYQITDSFSFDRIGEEDAVDEEPGAEARAEDELAIAQSLSDLGEVQYSAEEILDKAEEIGIDLGSIHLVFPPSPEDENKLMQLLYELSPSFKTKLDQFFAADRVTEGEIILLRNELLGLLDAVYSISGYSFTGHDDDTGEGYRENDVWVHKNGQRISRWNMFPDGGEGHINPEEPWDNPWEIFTWDFHAAN